MRSKKNRILQVFAGVFLLIGVTSALASLVVPTEAWAGYRYSWYTDGRCAEVTSDGYHVQYVDKRYCEDSVGFRYAWYTNGRCAEQTPDGYHVQYVDKWYCENS